MGKGLLRKAVRAALYSGAIALVVAVGVLSPRHEAVAQHSAGVSVPPWQTGYAIPIPKHGAIAGRGPAVNHPLLTTDPAGLQRAKNLAADRAASAQRGLKSTAGPYSVFNGTNFMGASASAGAGTPSDSTGAVSATNYVEMVNSLIEVRDRSGNLISTTALANFSFATTDCVFDPQILWDAQAGRWLYSFLDQVPVTPGNCNTISANYLDFGWSLTSDPTDLVNGWCQLGIGTGSNLFDYDKLGHDNNFIIIGANVFSNAGGGSFQTATITAITGPGVCPTSVAQFPPFTIFAGPNPQTPMLNADGTAAFTPVPADTADSSSVGYVVAAHQPPGSSPANKIMVWHVMANPNGSPNLVQDGDVNVANFGAPPAVPQPATGTTSCSTAGNCLDSLDSRLTQAVAHFDPDAGKETIWTQHAVLNSGVSVLSVERWYELIPGNASPRQQGNVSDSTLYIFNGAISPTEAGNEAVIFYNTGNNVAVTGLVSMRAQSRNSTTTLNTVANETIIASSTNNDNDLSCGVNHAPITNPCRWGDYSAARPDPANGNVVWGTVMMTGSGGTPSNAGWTSQVAAYTNGCSSVAVSPPTLTAIDGSINVFTATASGCSAPQYAFFLQYPNGTWTLQQAFSATNTWSWDSAAFPAGMYNIHVWANQTGDYLNSYEALGASAVTLTVAAPCATATTSPPTSAVPIGTTINFTTTSTGCPIPTYAYFVQDPSGTWTLARPFSTSGAFAWNTTGLVPGNYNIHVWATQRGHSTSTFEALGSATAALNICTGASVAGPGSNPQAGAIVTLMASSTGCTAPQYAFYVLYPNGVWHLGRTWGAATWNWDTSALRPGMYTIHVWANDTGDSTATFEALGSTTVTLTGCTSVAVGQDHTSPQVIGTTVIFTGTASVCTTPVYEFFLLDPGGIWHLEQTWGSPNTWSWDTTGFAPGTYTIHVWANGSNSDLSTFQANSGPNFVLTLPPPCTNAAVTPNSTTGQAGSTLPAYTLSSSGCTSPKYAVYVQYPDMSWNLVQPFSTSATFTWNTAGLGPGAYTIHAWASASGSGHDSIGSASVTLTGCTTASITPPSQSAGAGTIVNMTASGGGGCTSPQFEDWVQYPDGSWHLGRTWGAAAFAWDTTGLRPGSYVIHAWANAPGASTATWEAIGSATVTLTGCTSATVVPASGSGPVGTSVLFTVTATTGCTTPIYAFWVQYPDGTWHLGQPFSTTNTWTWTTAGRAKGTYTIHVWVNNQGADTSTYETIGSATWTLT